MAAARAVVAALVLVLSCAGCGEVSSAPEAIGPQANTNPFYDDFRACGQDGIREGELYSPCISLWF